jgi:hypothetical protein
MRHCKPVANHQPRQLYPIACSAGAAPAVKAEQDVPGMTGYLDSLKWDQNGLVAVIAQVWQTFYQGGRKS